MAKQGKSILVIGVKPSQIKTFSDILFSSVRTTKVGPRLYTRTGTWGGYVLTFLPLIGHITNIDTRKGFGWNECAPITIVENPKALIIKEKPEFRKAIRSLAITNDERKQIAHAAYAFADNVGLENSVEDATKAFRYYLIAAHNGSREAIKKVISCYEQGVVIGRKKKDQQVVVEQDNNKAQEWQSKLPK